MAVLDSRSTFSNASAGDDTYESKTLYPLMRVIGDKVTSDILPSYGLKLVGEFEDPRRKDIRLELEKQLAYERSHKLDEVRAMYYPADGDIGDERGSLLMHELKSSPAPEPEPEPTQPQQEAMEEDEGTKAAVDALYKWRKQAADGRMEKAMKFTNSAIPASVEKAIKSKIASLTDRTVILAVFEKYIEAMKPKPKINPLDVLKGIELGVKALEMRSK
jgi:hypothetical protein